MNNLISIYINDVEDYFRRMGGQGCYVGYRDWHASALILCLLFDLKVAIHINPSMANETNQLPLRVKDKLDKCVIDKKTFNEFVVFVKSHLVKLHSNELYRFEMFIEDHKPDYDKYYENLS